MKLLCIDGNSVINRAYFGIKPLNTKKGVPTNAIYGFFNIMIKLQREISPDETVVAFDVSRKTFRNEQYELYKANRHGMDEDLATQMPILKELLNLLGYKTIGCEGYEGDDVLGTLAKMCNENNDECIVATGDRDCLQLVNDKIKVCLIKTKENLIYDEQKVIEDFLVTPKQIIELKALMGDSSDNIPGVKGIGAKTATTLISQCETLVGVYENLENLNCTPRIKGLLINDKENAFLSQKLATIFCEVPFNLQLSDLKRQPVDEQKLRENLNELELFSFFDKFGLSKTQANLAPKTAFKFDVVENAKINDIKQKIGKEIILLLEDKKIFVCIENTIFVIEEDCDELLKHISAEKIGIVTFKAKQVIKRIKSLGLEDVNLKFDVELATYLLNSDSKAYVLDELCEEYLPDVSLDILPEFLPIAQIKMLFPKLFDALKEKDLLSLFENIEIPLCEVLADMEIEGFAVDIDGLKEFGETLDVDLTAIRSQIYLLAEEEFNINSPREIGRILFEKLGLPAKKKTKTGYSTNIEVLIELENKHEIVPYIIEYRKLTKLLSTYVVGLQKVVLDDHRVHSTFNQTETRTGRISSTEPNVQNIPIRTKRGSEMRKFFVAREGYTLVDADYSQIELRILAHIANDKNMIDAFINGNDIHAITASQVFNCPLDEMTPEIRSRAKAINFGIVYGISAFSLSKDINVSVGEAKNYINAYMESYSGVANYMSNVIKQVEEDGYAKTLYGRRRDLPDINSSNKMVKAFASRVARNMPIQGTAADIIKLAMIKVHKRIKKEQLDARLILQVHDELIIEAPSMQVSAVKKILQEEMQNAAKLKVVLLVDVNEGKTWFQAH